MLRALVSGIALGMILVSGASATAIGEKQPATPAVVAATAAARPIHAVLRYDPATTAACRSFSDDTSELCLLLALHVIRLSEKPLPGGAL